MRRYYIYAEKQNNGLMIINKELGSQQSIFEGERIGKNRRHWIERLWTELKSIGNQLQ